MNWKKLLSIGALTMFSASIATGQGTAPTIVQGDYISNVFGNSNFIKNPNAKLNTKDVTTVTATVTRSTTTPLVATSEFTVAIGTANGTATWATRTFDAGMKGQNCEARFSYRGFAATSKVHIKQGANTVATLSLTPATDPRIASINFPCGDLSAATTFQVTDTAILGGVNEIGGIYVGLATNMANVAQAEFVGSIVFGADCQFVANTNAFTTPSDATCTTTITGNVATVSGIKSAITVPNAKPGRYQVIYTGNLTKDSSTATECYFQFAESTVNMAQTSAYANTSAQVVYSPTTFIGDIEKSASGSYTFELQARNSTNTSTDQCRITGQGVALQKLAVYRFPSSSELVVTPERQNVFGGVVYTAENQNLFGTVANPTAFSSFNNSVWNKPAKLVGKAQVTTTNSGNDLGFSIPNLPVGNYKLEISGLLNAGNTGATDTNAAVNCNFKIVETTTSTDVARQMHQDFSITTSGSDETRDWTNSFNGVFNNTSIATRNFRLEAQKYGDATTGKIGVCQAFSNTATNSHNSNITFLLTPLDQPSNSALYVEGPVKAAATGAAIPAGYVGEILKAEDTGFQIATSATYRTISLTLTPGVWDVQSNCNMSRNGASWSDANLINSVTNQNSNPTEGYISHLNGLLPTTWAVPSRITRVRWDGTTNITEGNSNTSSPLVYSRCYPGAFTGGPVLLWQTITARRVN